MEREEQIIQLLHDIQGVLAYHQVNSIDNFPASGDLNSFLNTTALQKAVVKPEASVKPRQKILSKPRQESGKSNQAALAEITDDVMRCESCSLSKQQTSVSAGNGGGSNIRLFIVGHWSSVSEQSTVQAVFGYEEDRMLERMLAAIHLSMEEVFVTNLIKCGVGPDVQPQAEHIEICLSYLQRQIAAAAPELICTMGMLATRALLKHSQPLSRLRGRFYAYPGPDGKDIPLLPTYHPGYLLQNPEMKRATWSDLQALEKRLKQ
ncbi:MAG TPA: uracil-DNA glycosylase [Desulfocapsa sulfexigens]|nr:uracil-DNA glycosylase [Desulfocapsa sulfexigens]